MLHATPHGIFSWDFTLSKDGVALAEIDMSWFRERAEVKIGEQTYTVYRESVMQGTFALQSGDQVLAQAQKVGAFTRAFEVNFAGRQLELKALSAWKRQFGLFENGAQIGHIGPTNWLRRKAVIDLPGDIPLPVQVFLFWLVVILWRRAAGSAAAASAGGS